MEVMMEEKKKKLAYEKPCLYELNDYNNGKGACSGPGSGDSSYCSTGASATGEGCINGTGASADCDNGTGF
jgi:hypothetical protein